MSSASQYLQQMFGVENFDYFISYMPDADIPLTQCGFHNILKYKFTKRETFSRKTLHNHDNLNNTCLSDKKIGRIRTEKRFS